MVGKINKIFKIKNIKEVIKQVSLTAHLIINKSEYECKIKQHTVNVFFHIPHMFCMSHGHL